MEGKFLAAIVLALMSQAPVVEVVHAGDLAITKENSTAAVSTLAELQEQKVSALISFEQALSAATLDQRASLVAQISAQHALITAQSEEAISKIPPVEDSFAQFTPDQILPANASAALQEAVVRNTALDRQSSIANNDVTEMQASHFARVRQIESDAPLLEPIYESGITTRNLINSANFDKILAERTKSFGQLEILQTRLHSAKAEDRAAIIRDWESKAALEFFSAVSATSNLGTTAE